jgi:hypothetical protein
MARTLHEALSQLPPEALVRIGANAMKERAECEAVGTENGQLYAAIWDAVGVMVDRVLLENSLRTPDVQAFIGRDTRPESTPGSCSAVGHL